MALGAGGYKPVRPFRYDGLWGVPFTVVGQTIWGMNQAFYHGVRFLARDNKE